MSEHACPLCGTVSILLNAETTDRLLHTTPKTFNLCQCRACDVVFIAPSPTSEELKAFYPPGYWWCERSASKDVWARLKKRLESIYRRIVLWDHVRFVMQTTRSIQAEGLPVLLLDVGCSGGTLLHELSRKGVPGRGLDFSREAVAHAREIYSLDCAVGDLEHFPWPGQKFSVLTCFHVLEHARNPRQFLKAVHRVLVEKGRIVIQVPNLRSLQWKVFGARWYGLDPPRHLVNYTDQALVHLLKESGFEVIREKRFSLRDDAASWVSSAFPSLDPMARAVLSFNERNSPAEGSWLGIWRHFIYFLMLFGALPLALVDSLLGRGATIMVEARRRLSAQ